MLVVEITVLVHDVHERRLGVVALAHEDAVLAQEQPHVAPRGAFLLRVGLEQLDGVLALAAVKEDLGAEGHGVDALGGAGLGRVLLGVGVAPLLEHEARERHERFGLLGALDGEELLLRIGVAPLARGLDRRGDGTRRRRDGRRRNRGSRRGVLREGLRGGDGEREEEREGGADSHGWEFRPPGEAGVGQFPP